MIVYVGPHAAERFVERVRPDLSLERAGVELKRLIDQFGFECPRPEWCDPPTKISDGAFYVEVSDGVVALILPPDRPNFLPAVVTVMIRAGSPRRNGERRRRKAKVKAEKRRGRRPRGAEHFGQFND